MAGPTSPRGSCRRDFSRDADADERTLLLPMGGGAARLRRPFHHRNPHVSRLGNRPMGDATRVRPGPYSPASHADAPGARLADGDTTRLGSRRSVARDLCHSCLLSLRHAASEFPFPNFRRLPGVRVRPGGMASAALSRVRGPGSSGLSRCHPPLAAPSSPPARPSGRRRSIGARAGPHTQGPLTARRSFALRGIGVPLRQLRLERPALIIVTSGLTDTSRQSGTMKVLAGRLSGTVRLFALSQVEKVALPGRANCGCLIPWATTSTST